MKLCSCKVCKSRRKVSKREKKLIAVHTRNYLPVYKTTKQWFALVDKEVKSGLARLATGIKKADAYAIVNDLADWERLQLEGRRMYPQHQIRVYSQAMGTAAEYGKIKTPFNLPNRHAIAWSKQHITPFMQDLVLQTRQGIQNLVTGALERGLGTKEMAREVRRIEHFAMNPRQANALTNYRMGLIKQKAKIDSALSQAGGSVSGAIDLLGKSVPKAWVSQVKNGKFDVTGRVAKEAAKKERYRAEMIARTEVARAVSAGTLNGYKVAGATHVRWDAALDACDICIGYDGNEYTLLEAGGLQPEHVNCRCVWVPIDTPAAVVSRPEVGGLEGDPAQAVGDEYVPAKVTDPKQLKFYDDLKNPDIEWRDRATGEDAFLRGILREQGFDGKPQLISKAEMAKYVEQGETKLVRGISGGTNMSAEEATANAARFTKQFQGGDLFVGHGVYGNGTYTAYGEKSLTTAKGYAGSQGTVMEMVLRKEARIIDEEKLNQLVSRAKMKLADKFEKSSKKLYKQTIQGKFTAEESAMRYEKLAKGRSRAELPWSRITGDEGRYAAALGYDAIDIPTRQFMVILNRTALRVVK